MSGIGMYGGLEMIRSNRPPIGLVQSAHGERGSIGQSKSRGVAAGECRRLRREVHADAEGGSGTLSAAPAAGSRCRCRDRECGAAADVRRRRPARPRSGFPSPGRGIRVAAETRNSRLQNSRRPMIRASGSRASGGPAVRLVGGGVDRPGRIADQVVPCEAEGVREQQPRLQRGLSAIPAGGRRRGGWPGRSSTPWLPSRPDMPAGRRRAEDHGDGTLQPHSSAARRAAWSSAVRASMNSSRSPCITRSIL